MSRATPFLVRAEAAILAALKTIGHTDDEWFTAPATVVATASEDFRSMARPALCVVMGEGTHAPEMASRYKAEAQFDIWCLDDGGQRDTTRIYNLISDVERALALAFRPTSGVFDSGYMFLAGSSVDFPLSQAENAAIGKVSVQCNWQWGISAP